MVVLSRIRKFLGDHGLVLLDIGSFLACSWIVENFSKYGNLPTWFLAVVLVLLLLNPAQVSTTKELRWWAKNFLRRLVIGCAVSIGFYWIGALSPAAVATSVLWPALAALWPPPVLRRRIVAAGERAGGWLWHLAVTWLPVWGRHLFNLCRRAGRWLWHLVGRKVVGDTVAESTMLSIFGILVRRFWPQSLPGELTWYGLLLVWSASALVLRNHFLRPGVNLAVRYAGLLVALAIWARVQGAALIPSHVNLALIGFALLSLPHLVRRRFGRMGDQTRAEEIRVAMVLLIPFLFFQSLAHPVVHGTGDAYWYAMMMADMIEQVRAGVFPVFGGQSIYQFNGAVYSLRIAPAFHYLGAAVDFITGRTLSAISVQNLLIVGWAMATGLSAYVCLGKLIVNRWVALAGACLFVTCPGVMSIAYNTDLYMSWTTVPFIPLVMLAAARAYENATFRNMILLGSSLGFLWWGHTPIALWAALIVGIFQVHRSIIHRRSWRTDLPPLLSCILIFALVAAFPICAALVYPPEPGVNVTGFQQASAGTIAYFLKIAFPGNFLPLKMAGMSLPLFQLGYAMWMAFVFAAIHVFRTKGKSARAFTVVAGGIAILLIPWPYASEWMWTIIPAFIRNITGNWVMNRLYLILSATVLTSAALAFRYVEGGLTSARKRYMGAFLFTACAWSCWEGNKFGAASDRAHRASATSVTDLYSENILITRFAYLVFPKIPAYFSHGVVDPEMEHRFFDDDGRMLWSNESAVRNAAAHHDARTKSIPLGKLAPLKEDPNIWRLSAPVELKFSRRYLLQFEFPGDPELTGILQLIGKSFFREYELPLSGGSKSFGTTGTAAKTLSIWTSDPGGDRVTVGIVSQSPKNSTAALGQVSVNLIEYDHDLLPAQVVSWVPYRVKVKSDHPGWLETPRSYQVYWRSEAGPESVKRSPEGLVMLKQPGYGEVLDLHYQVPVGFRILFWGSAFTLCASGLYLLRNDPPRADKPL